MNDKTFFSYGDDLFPLSAEKKGFLISFTREATDDNTRETDQVQSYITLTTHIPNYETLNVKVLWTAFQLLSRMNEKEKAQLLVNPTSLFCNDDKYLDEVIKRLIPTTTEEGNIKNMHIKMSAHVYSYMRLILNVGFKNPTFGS